MWARIARWWRYNAHQDRAWLATGCSCRCRTCNDYLRYLLDREGVA